MVFVALGLELVACAKRGAPSNRCDESRWDNSADCLEGDTVAAPIADCTAGSGVCVEEAPDGWMGPNLYWIGPMGQEPPCPLQAPKPGTMLFGDLGPVPHSCPSCACAPSETSCFLPTKWTVSSAKCSDAGGARQTTFDVLAANWSGDCSTDNALSPGATCGEDFCAQSVTVAAPDVASAPCKPLTGDDGKKPGPPWPWGKVAQECLVTPSDTCEGRDGHIEGDVCIPVPGDFLACISLHHGGHEGEVDCPELYGEKHVMYGSAIDHRDCTECQCGAPEGAECAVIVSAFEDAQCSDPVISGLLFSSDGQACHDIPSGVGLGGKTAEMKATVPGTCPPSGGAPSGAVEPADKVTLCCHHEVAP